jgi:uncharacterized membrane protein (UPF0127 family)
MKSHHKHFLTLALFVFGIALAVGLFYANGLYHVSVPVVTDYATDNQGLPVTATITTPKGVDIYARVASTPATQQLGLSYFPSLPDSQGMLFTFSQSGIQKFWMKGMAFPLDIIWLKHATGTKYTVVSVIANLSPDTYPQTYGPDANVDDVLEINATKAAQFGIQDGGTVEIRIDQ